jgi:hypothetical protein
MKKFLTFLFLCISVQVFSQKSEPKQDSMKIRACALDYIEGWYAGDTIRMDRALHPDMVKMQVSSLDGAYVLTPVSKSSMMEYTRAGYGKAVPKDKLKNEITILDQFGGIASVKIVSYNYVDYLQLAKWNGEWKILEVLWQSIR